MGRPPLDGWHRRLLAWVFPWALGRFRDRCPKCLNPFVKDGAKESGFVVEFQCDLCSTRYLR